MVPTQPSLAHPWSDFIGFWERNFSSSILKIHLDFKKILIHALLIRLFLTKMLFCKRNLQNPQSLFRDLFKVLDAAGVGGLLSAPCVCLFLPSSWQHLNGIQIPNVMGFLLSLNELGEASLRKPTSSKLLVSEET